MITIMPAGRLGNHLFQFAFGLAMSARLKTDFIFNTSEIEELFELKRYNAPADDKPSKTVYAPQYWLGHMVKREYPQNIIPDDWIQLEA